MKIGKRLKVLRKKGKITLKDLSLKSGVQIATLSRMENDVMTGTIESHMNICKALGVSLADFYSGIEEDRKTIALNKKKPSFLHSKESTVEMLTAKSIDKKMMPLLIKIQKSGKTHLEKNQVGTEKFIYVLDGKISITIGKESYALSKGDSIYFDASSPHVLHNENKSEAQVISVITPPAI